MSSNIPHPRTVFDPIGGEAVDESFLDALQRGRLHHAWLLIGPNGVGKATFAYRVARRLLGAAADSRHGLLGSDADDPVSRQVIARSHPDLLVLQRETEDGKTRRGIPVDEARMLPDFFNKSPAIAPYRVAIVDAADDLNANAANAVLKTLEEPPARGVLLLVSHAPGSLLPTIRSRCRRLKFDAPPIEMTRSWLAQRTGLSEQDAENLLVMARGAPGRAWRLAEAGALDLDAQVKTLLSRLPNCDEALISSLQDSFRPPNGSERFNLFFNILGDNIHQLVRDRAIGGNETTADAWAEVWEYLISLPAMVEAVNLDRSDALFTALGRLRAIA